MTDRHLQSDFEYRTFNIDGIKRECYYCTLEEGGAWIWLHPNKEDKCNKINFVVRYESQLEDLKRQVDSGEEIRESDYGYLSFQ